MKSIRISAVAWVLVLKWLLTALHAADAHGLAEPARRAQQVRPVGIKWRGQDIKTAMQTCCVCTKPRILEKRYWASSVSRTTSRMGGRERMDSMS